MTEYSIIYADPAWSYNDKAMNRGGAERHYVTTDADLMAKLNIPVAKDAVIFMWATMPQLPVAIRLMQDWGFSYKTVAFVWVKANKKATDSPFWGMGHWTRANAELCLMGVRGKPKREGKGVHQLIVEPEIITDPVMAHSRKPAVVRDKIVELMGDIPRLEMFAREATEGWDVWGNEAPGSVSLVKKKSLPVKKKALPKT
ncbi:MAG: DNA methyltransferase [Pantoea ananatis]|nr:DNA methyltransferase [Pantoea ananatis]